MRETCATESGQKAGSANTWDCPHQSPPLRCSGEHVHKGHQGSAANVARAMAHSQQKVLLLLTPQGVPGPSGGLQ